MLSTGLHVVAGLAGAIAALLTLRSALRTLMVPRGVPDCLTRMVFRALDAVTRQWVSHATTFRQRDRRSAHVGARLLLALLATWMVSVWLSGAAVQWAVTHSSATQALLSSGAAFTTIGGPNAGRSAAAAADLEAVVGLGLLALAIGYLPNLHSAFFRREALITKLTMRTGPRPPLQPSLPAYGGVRHQGPC